jgi:hypothetical protein
VISAWTLIPAAATEEGSTEMMTMEDAMAEAMVSAWVMETYGCQQARRDESREKQAILVIILTLPEEVRPQGLRHSFSRSLLRR